MIELLYFVVGALAYRLRGGGFAAEEVKFFGKELPTSVRRLAWPIGLGIIIAFSDILMAIIAMPLLYAGTVLGYFGAQFDLSIKENRNPHNYMLLTARGMLICLPAAIGLSMFTGTSTGFGGVLAGALFVPCYRLWALSNNKFGNVGEMLLGGLMAVGLMYSI